MNPDLHNSSDDSFDELLTATLAEYASDQPRPGLDRRILASLPPHRTPIRWPLWASLATALAVAIVTVSLHLHHPSTAPNDHAAPTVASSEILPTRPNSSKESSSSRPKRWTASSSIAQWRDPRSLPPRVLPAFTAANPATQAPTPTTAANEEVKIDPIKIDPIVIPPLPTAEAVDKPIPPIDIKPIKIDPIQISSLKIDDTDSNE
jgi:hypothetical protein